MSLVVSKETGSIVTVNILNKKEIPLEQQFYWYNGNKGNFTTTSGSGVYAFNPLNNSALPLNLGRKNVTVFKGMDKFYCTIISSLSFPLSNLYKVEYILKILMQGI